MLIFTILIFPIIEHRKFFHLLLLFFNFSLQYLNFVVIEDFCFSVLKF